LEKVIVFRELLPHVMINDAVVKDILLPPKAVGSYRHQPKLCIAENFHSLLRYCSIPQTRLWISATQHASTVYDFKNSQYHV